MFPDRLSENKYGGKVLLLGYDAAMLACVQEIGDEIGLAMLPALPAPFGSGNLQHRIVMLRSVLGRNGRRSRDVQNFVFAEVEIDRKFIVSRADGKLKQVSGAKGRDKAATILATTPVNNHDVPSS
jgi:hypothetical protein